MTFVKLGVAVTAATIAMMSAPAFAAERTLNAVTGLQQTNIIAQSFLQTFMKPVNAAGKGIIKINYVGGQEVVPPRKAAAALKRGQFDMLSCPTAYYIGTVPEGYGILASNQGPKILRKNGAFELLQKIYKQKAGSHLLAWGESMTSYHMYLHKAPKLSADGVPNLTGYKMRATGTYRPLFRALGATTINIKSSEVITAIQRGTVDGYGFTDVSVISLGLDKVTKYRVLPNFYQTNQVLTVNPKTWDSLTKKQRDFLNAQAIIYETASVKFVEKSRLAEEAQMKKAGIKDVVLKGAAAQKYLDTAHGEIWKELKKRSKFHDQLKPLLYKPGKPIRQVDTGRMLDQKR